VFYKKELDAIKKVNRFRERKIFDKNLIDLASNDYLGLGTDKKLLSNSFNYLQRSIHSPKSSMLINGYTEIHQKFENLLTKSNGFEDGIVVGSGFLANISLIESLIRKNDILFIDSDYHASGVLATKLTAGKVIYFNHNSFNDLENKIKDFKLNNNFNYKRIFIAIEGIYSMGGDLAEKKIFDIAKKYKAIMIVDEAHSSGVIGKNLNGILDFYNIEITPYIIKMGTLGKAYGSYGAYILASKEIIEFLINRAKPIIYSTAPSLMDIALAYQSKKYIMKNRENLSEKIRYYRDTISNELNRKIDSLIIPIEQNNNKDVINIQNILLKENIMVGAIRTPTVKKPIIRLIAKLDIELDIILKAIKIGKFFK